MKKLRIILNSVIILVTLLASISCAVPVHAASNHPIIVGSKTSPESKTVSEIYALALEHAGYRVTRKQNIANSVVYKATKSGQIGIYPDYTGTIVEAYHQQNGQGKSSAQMDRLARRDAAKDGLALLNYAPGNDSQGVGMRTSIARKYHIRTLSDLQRHAGQIRLASQGEFEKRADALPAMNKAYGKFHFKSIKDYDSSLLYVIMAHDQADAAPVSTTDGQLATGQFTLLKDNKHIWPPYNLVPVVNRQILRTHPRMAKVINRVDAKLTTKQLLAMNKKVGAEGQNYKTAARNWYQENMR